MSIFVLSGKLEGEKAYDIADIMADTQQGMDKHEEDEDKTYVNPMDNYGH